MPWSAAPLRLGRGWVMAPDAGSLRARWNALVGVAEEEQRGVLFCPTRSRTLHSAVGQLPGHAAPTGRMARESGPCPEPVRVLHGAFDQQWLIPDQRLIDAARPEMWRVADARQVFVVEQDELLVLSTLVPDGRSPAGRAGRIRPLYRRPGGREPNLAPGLTGLLAGLLGREVGADDVLAWITATAHPGADGFGGHVVPLTTRPELWDMGVAVGRRMRWVELRGEGSGKRPRLPGGQRPYVRAPLPACPAGLRYDAEERALLVGEGRIAPVPKAVWEFRVGGVGVLESWFASRTATAPAGTLAAIGVRAWPQEWTSELLELVTVLALLAGLRGEQRELGRLLDAGPCIGTDDLRRAGILPVPDAVRRPASVLDHHEEGPEGQFVLV
ncbi:DNA methyltransferase [Streptomyces sp. RB6PN25]|uniref:DNA methyltransferase n=2 Tax=Streptomyces humicola TaxID=2953240 RepID=A0ABT1Q031_9ACTN|nr:DNA methyltransferase [Streptomyces humicola]